MAWQRVSLRVPAGDAERLSDALLEAGALSVDVADAAAGTADEHPLFGEPGADPAAAWADNVVTALFSPDAGRGKPGERCLRGGWRIRGAGRWKPSKSRTGCGSRRTSSRRSG